MTKIANLGSLKELDDCLANAGYPERHPYRSLLISMAKIDAGITASQYRGTSDNNDRPPNGDDYNLLWNAILYELKDVKPLTKS